MSEEEPKAEDRLGEHVKDGVGNDFAINVNLASAVGNTPNTV